jgi:phosphonoacetate hydrolase
MTKMITVNARQYNWPTVPVVVVCIDGSQPGVDGQMGYIEEAIKAGVAPFFERLMTEGTSRIAQSAMPSFTNPNNLSIVTGRPPNFHGIAGNYFYDRARDEEVMMNDPEFLRADTIFKGFLDAGAKICLITAKDKLLRLLGNGLGMSSGRAVCFSAEKADQATLQGNGIERVVDLVKMPVPQVYSTELSEFVFAAGVEIMKRDRPDLMYLSTTDYLQHKVAPGTPEANAFYAMMDGYLAKLDQLGCILSITADHGMSAKHDSDGAPRVVYLQTLIDDWIGEGNVRVILPITDPYVAHHGALGSFATLHIDDAAGQDIVADKLSKMDEVEAVYSNEEACEKLELPSDRIGDLVVVSTRSITLGTSAQRHDLSQLNGALRSHGGQTESSVPFLVNRKIELDEAMPLRNFDIFDVALNRVTEVNTA